MDRAAFRVAAVARLDTQVGDLFGLAMVEAGTLDAPDTPFTTHFYDHAGLFQALQSGLQFSGQLLPSGQNVVLFKFIQRGQHGGRRKRVGTPSV